MAGPSKLLLTTLEPLVGRVRAVLRDMEPNDVPVAVRKVAAYTGKRLPPPLLKSLVVELDRNEWLRTKVRDEAGEVDDSVARAFLDRPDGWWMEISDAAISAAVEDASVEDLGPQLAARDSQLSEAKRRITELRKAAADTEREAKALRKQLRDSSRQPASAADRDAEREHDRLVAQLAAAEERSRAAEQRLDELKRRKLKRSRTSVESNESKRVVGLGDPVAAARRLDLQAAALAAAVRGDPPPYVDHHDGVVEPESSATLPAGIAPDTVGAVEWLLRSARPMPIVVDGYNLTFLLEPGDFTSAASRQRLISELERFLRYAVSSHRIVAVFDSSVEIEAQPEKSEGGVEILFATETENADDEIVERVRGLDGRAVVITNDRELRERVDELGALALWGRALVDWIGTG